MRGTVHERGAQELRDTINDLNARLEQMQCPMTPEEYEEAKGILVDVLPVICGALSEHIQQRHAKLINQYQDLEARTGECRLSLSFLSS